MTCHRASSVTREPASLGPNLALWPHFCGRRYDQTYLIHKKMCHQQRGKERQVQSWHKYKNGILLIGHLQGQPTSMCLKSAGQKGFYSLKEPTSQKCEKSFPSLGACVPRNHLANVY